MAGSTWLLPATEPLEVIGPQGLLQLQEVSASVADADRGGAADAAATGQSAAVVPLLGRYLVKLGEESQLRIVTLDDQEITRQPQAVDTAASGVTEGGVTREVDASAELAVLLFLLCVAELLLRIRPALRRRARAAG